MGLSVLGVLFFLSQVCFFLFWVKIKDILNIILIQVPFMSGIFQLSLNFRLKKSQAYDKEATQKMANHKFQPFWFQLKPSLNLILLLWHLCCIRMIDTGFLACSFIRWFWCSYLSFTLVNKKQWNSLYGVRKREQLALENRWHSGPTFIPFVAQFCAH